MSKPIDIQYISTPDSRTIARAAFPLQHQGGFVSANAERDNEHPINVRFTAGAAYTCIDLSIAESEALVASLTYAIHAHREAAAQAAKGA